MDRETYFTRFKLRNALIQVLAEGMAEDYEMMESDYHPVDGKKWKPFDPQHIYKRILESAQHAGANSDDESMEVDFSEFNSGDLNKWEELIDHIEEQINWMS